ncbi:hypothetical protein EGR_06568 [Echinococcus granulosus]|uniref:EF-hand domain-containing protein n=1 Tax=Echinococcus granulosus TaxID=6210 RepID=W6UCU8_ECHGR|nr:hypothetical protein EGR_06568 [Echinococcus granulosus]EUB58581.1 hypothetical protein EGR_06568 [Echinococcus granulosus]
MSVAEFNYHFLAVDKCTITWRLVNPEEAAKEFWRTFDLNQDGQITAEEFNMVLARLPDDSVDIACMFNLNECFFGFVFASFKAEYRRSCSVQDLNRPFQTNILRIEHLKKMSL